ncbi:MAG: hypothetical protein ACOCSD_06820 [Halolamina sp.]
MIDDRLPVALGADEPATDGTVVAGVVASLWSTVTDTANRHSPVRG